MTKPLPADAVSEREAEKTLWKYQDDWAQRVQHNGEVSGLFTDYHYYGTVTLAGRPRKIRSSYSRRRWESVSSRLDRITGGDHAKEASKEVQVGDGPVKILSATADQMFLDIGSHTAKLPHYTGELELTNHSAGSLSSEAYQKRWNQKNELLADAAEKASVAASWLGGRALSAEAFERCVDAGDGRAVSRHHGGHGDAARRRILMERRRNRDEPVRGGIAGREQTVIAAMDTRGQGMPVVVL